MTPAVAPCAKVRGAAAAVFLERGRDLNHALAEQGGFDDHLAGELHAGSAEIEAFVGVDGEGADAAVEVADGRAEEPAAEEAEHGVAEIPVQRWHRAGAYASAEAIAHDEFGAVAELGEEARSVREVVAVVGVGHQNVLAARSEDAGVERSAVTADGYGDEARAVVVRNLLRAIGRAVVSNDDLAGDAIFAQRGVGLVDAGGESLGLIEAGHDDSELKWKLSRDGCCGGTHGPPSRVVFHGRVAGVEDVVPGVRVSRRVSG